MNIKDKSLCPSTSLFVGGAAALGTTSVMKAAGATGAIQTIFHKCAGMDALFGCWG